MTCPVDDCAVHHFGLLPVQSRHEAQHCPSSQLAVQFRSQTSHAVLTGIGFNPDCNRNMKEEVPDPFLLEELEFEINIPKVSHSDSIPIDQVNAARLATSGREFQFRSRAVETM